MRQIVDKILDRINGIKEDSILFNEGKLSPVNKADFHDIAAKASNKKLIFIDGGNLEILKSPSLSLFFNRIVYVIYQNNKRVKTEKVEFYSLTSTANIDGKLIFSTDFFLKYGNLQLDSLAFDSMDPLLRFGKNRAQISIVGDIIRRISELSIIYNLREKDAFIILDGTLERKYPYENIVLESALKHAEEYNMVLCALAKTTDLLTVNGNSAAGYIVKSCEKDIWKYNAARINNPDHDADVFFLKLNRNSKYVFRFEVSNKKLYDIDEILNLLRENSRDQIFPGYPFGLVEADRFARVSNKEKDRLFLQLKMYFKKDFKLIEPYLNAMNAHDVLDNIS